MVRRSVGQAVRWFGGHVVRWSDSQEVRAVEVFMRVVRVVQVVKTVPVVPIVQVIRLIK